MGRQERLKQERRRKRIEQRDARRRRDRTRPKQDVPPTTSQRSAIRQTFDVRGIPGQHQRLVIKPVFADPTDPRNDLPVGGGHGVYRVVFTLARPGVLPVPETEFSFDPDIPGDSHLAVLPPAAAARPALPGANAIELATGIVGGEEIVFVGYANARGFLGRLIADFEAKDFRDAEHKSSRALAPTLSNWSLHLDTPLHVWRIHLRNLDNGAEEISIVNPSFEMPFALAGDAIMSVDLQGFASLYREALESNSPVYQFLCLFKIAEGVRWRRNHLAADARKRGDGPRARPVERVPKEMAEFEPRLNAIYQRRGTWDDMALDSIFVDETRGRKFNEVLSHELTSLRVDIAHALSDVTGKMTHNADEPLHVLRINKWLPLLKCMVRRMLKNDFPGEFLAHLEEDGTTTEAVKTELEGEAPETTELL